MDQNKGAAQLNIATGEVSSKAPGRDAKVL